MQICIQRCTKAHVHTHAHRGISFTLISMVTLVTGQTGSICILPGMRRQLQLSLRLPEATCCVQTWNRPTDSIKPQRDTKQALQTANVDLQVHFNEHSKANFKSIPLKLCKYFLSMLLNWQNKQAWSACFKCNTVFVLQVLFSLEGLPALPAVILN